MTFIKRALLKIVFFILHFILLLCLLFGTLALYYSELESLWLRYALAIVFFAIGAMSWWKFFRQKQIKGLLVSGIMFAGILLYWSTLEPSNDREWREDVAVLSRAEFSDDGNTVKIINFRDFEYTSQDDFIVHYEDRIVELSHLTSVDYFVSYWGAGSTDNTPVGHTFLSFNFDNGPPVSISIEARYETHESYNPLASIFKQFELIYIVGDESDIVGLRTDFRGEEVFRYPINVSPEIARDLFMIYMRRINQLAEKPEFYHLLSDNCTLNIFRYANKLGRTGSMDIRILLNGWSDRYLYQNGYFDTELPFRELRAQAYLNDLVKERKDDMSFSELIRQRLPNRD